MPDGLTIPFPPLDVWPVRVENPQMKTIWDWLKIIFLLVWDYLEGVTGAVGLVVGFVSKKSGNSDSDTKYFLWLAVVCLTISYIRQTVRWRASKTKAAELDARLVGHETLKNTVATNATLIADQQQEIATLQKTIEDEKPKLDVKAKQSVRGGGGVRQMLTVIKVVNVGKAPVTVVRTVIFQKPMVQMPASGLVIQREGELVFQQPNNKPLKLEPTGLQEYTHSLGLHPEFMAYASEKGGGPAGKGYVELSDETKFEFDFSLATDEMWRMARSD